MKKKLFIMDTTLRDGEQSPDIYLKPRDKLAIALQLEKLGVDIIEAGFPASSPGQFKTCRMIALFLNHSAVSVMARAVKADILKAWEAVKMARYPILHISVPTSPIHRRYKLGKKPEEIIAMGIEAVRQAKKTGAEVEVGAEDATRTERDFLVQFCLSMIGAGASIINIPDTLGVMTPDEYGSLIRFLWKNLPEVQSGSVRLSAHCHDDLGLAAANTLSAIRSGAAQIETTVLGIGERAGNAALEEIAAALFHRRDYFAKNTNLNLRELLITCQMVSSLTGYPIPSGKAVVGINAFAHSSGIHQDGFLKNRRTYEWINPQIVGRLDSEILLNGHSGSSGLKFRLNRLGIDSSLTDIGRIMDIIQKQQEKKSTFTDTDLIKLTGRKQEFSFPLIEMLELTEIKSDYGSYLITIRFFYYGLVMVYRATGKSPLDALFSTLQTFLPTGLTLHHFSCVCSGSTGPAPFKAEVSFLADGFILTERFSDEDYLKAIAGAYIETVNRFHVISAAGRSDESEFRNKDGKAG